MAAHMLRVNQLLNPGRRRQHLCTSEDVLEILSDVDSDTQLSDDENMDDGADDDPDFFPEPEENDDEDGEEEDDNNGDPEGADGSSGDWKEDGDVPLATISELAKRKRV
ncbi:hypothetical protein LSAT2_019298 [Lamellibrachia satsuma]|nr:hypothetical protein LSAT2_019298 [Lamellibrachia satsuma]